MLRKSLDKRCNLPVSKVDARLVIVKLRKRFAYFFKHEIEPSSYIAVAPFCIALLLNSLEVSLPRFLSYKLDCKNQQCKPQ